MNSYYKLKSTFLLFTSVFFVSCDGDTDFSNGGNSSTDITPSDETVSAGELFTFEDLLFPDDEQFLNTLRITSDNVGVLGSVTYNYVSTGIHTASLTGVVPVREALDDAVTQLFSINNSSNSEVRSLLLVTNPSNEAPILTDAELTRLVELLNVNGAGVSLNPDDTNEIVAIPTRVFNFTFTSTLAERSAGIAAGTYSLEARSQVVGFNITTLFDGEGNSFQYYFPIVTDDFLGIQTFEAGTFTLQLNNSIGF